MKRAGAVVSRAALICLLAPLSLAGAAATTNAGEGSGPGTNIRLGPILHHVHEPDGTTETEILFETFRVTRDASGRTRGQAFPVFWGNDYFHVFPLFWHWDDNFLLIPVAWQVGPDGGVGVVLWGSDYFHVAPLYWHWEHKTLIFPGVYDEKSAERRDFSILWRLVRYERRTCNKGATPVPAGGCESATEEKKLSVLWRLLECGAGPQGAWVRLLFSPKIPL